MTTKIIDIKKIDTKLYYEIGMSLLAVATVTITLMDFLGKIHQNSKLLYLDSGILIIFTVDYFTRLLFSRNKLEFVKKNVPDLIAIIPFSSIFRIFRMSKLLRVVRLTKVFRMSFFIMKFKRTASKFLNTNGFIYVLLITLGIITIGSISIYYVERGITLDSFMDAVWWAFVTATTVGYGDISPATGIGRIIAAILMTTGIGFIGMLTGTIATYFISPKKEVKLDKNKVLDLSCLNDEKYREMMSYFEYLKNK